MNKFFKVMGWAFLVVSIVAQFIDIPAPSNSMVYFALAMVMMHESKL